jgi:hypothetical protein
MLEDIINSIFIFSLLLGIILYHTMNFGLKEKTKHLTKFELTLEMYDFLLSEEGEQSTQAVASLCNSLGICLESDNIEEGPEQLK